MHANACNRYGHFATPTTDHADCCTEQVRNFDSCAKSVLLEILIRNGVLCRDSSGGVIIFSQKRLWRQSRSLPASLSHRPSVPWWIRGRTFAVANTDPVQVAWRLFFARDGTSHVFNVVPEL